MSDHPSPSPEAEGLLRSITFWPNDTNKSDEERKAALRSYIASLEADRARLDFCEAQSNGDPWVARESTTGRGFRLANSHAEPHFTTAREAIDAAIQCGITV